MWSPIPYNASLVDRVDILVSPRHSNHVKQYLSCAGMNVDVIEENLQKAIDEENIIDDEVDELHSKSYHLMALRCYCPVSQCVMICLNLYSFPCNFIPENS